MKDLQPGQWFCFEANINIHYYVTSISFWSVFMWVYEDNEYKGQTSYTRGDREVMIIKKGGDNA
jgi:hypothetical protein